MLQMNKSVSPRPSLSSVAGVLIPISVLCAMGLGLIIGVIALAGNIRCVSNVTVPAAASYVREEAPDINEQIVRW